jgi:hypothetical protein
MKKFHSTDIKFSYKNISQKFHYILIINSFKIFLLIKSIIYISLFHLII